MAMYGKAGMDYEN